MKWIRALSVRKQLTLTYTALLLVAATVMLSIAWVSFIRGRASLRLPTLDDFSLIFSPNILSPQAFVPAGLITLTFLLLFGLVGGWILAGRILAPLDDLARAARSAATTFAAPRMATHGPHDGLRDFVDNFNNLAALLDEADAGRQRFAANASHELRTPLATMKTMLDVARKDPHESTRELVERLREVNARSLHITDSLLLISQAGQRTFTPEPVDMSLVLEEVAETLLPLAESHRVQLTADAEPAHVLGSPALLLQMTKALVHNAIIHNLVDGTVLATTTATAGIVTLTVENTGTELPPPLLTTLTEPFQRGRGRILNGETGAGLGLAVVRSVAEAHGGRLTISSGLTGGLRVAVDLPAHLASSGARPS